MRIIICAVGRLRAGPEKSLIDNYIKRASRTGRALGLGPVQITEVEDRKGGGPTGEAELLRRAIPSGATVCVLDERGTLIGSPEIANRLAGWRDNGQSDLALVIGGADGLESEFRDGADFKLSFGPMVWPHLLVRVMLAEQVYRATTILAGGPYHRA